MRQFAISDIHGCARTFRALVQQLELTTIDELYLLGDYIDRGPDSKGVLDYIFQLQQLGIEITCLRGNHEQLMIEASENTYNLNNWLANGGDVTLRSFAVSSTQEIPYAYRKFIQELPYYYELDDYILVHAGLNFELPDPLEGMHSMLWIKNWYDDIDMNWLDGQIIVHGHQPRVRDELEAQLVNLAQLPVIAIDNGCVVEAPGKHHLIALDLQKQIFISQPCVD